MYLKNADFNELVQHTAEKETSMNTVMKINADKCDKKM